MRQQPAADTAASTDAPSAAAESTAEASAASHPDDLLIPLASLSSEPSFIDRVQDGVNMQLIALLDAGQHAAFGLQYVSGLRRIAVCLSSITRTVYCCAATAATHFRWIRVGRVSGGCNPMPVPEYASDGTNVIVASSELARASESFVNWKAEQ